MINPVQNGGVNSSPSAGTTLFTAMLAFLSDTECRACPYGFTTRATTGYVRFSSNLLVLPNLVTGKITYSLPPFSPLDRFARLAEDPLNRRNVKCHVDQLLARSEDEDEAMSGNLTVSYPPPDSLSINLPRSTGAQGGQRTRSDECAVAAVLARYVCAATLPLLLILDSPQISLSPTQGRFWSQ